ncbi:MAG: FAD:protein FMN transferase, partial [Polyangiaceae bacterium]
MGTFRAMGTEVTVRAACEIQSVEQYLTEVATERFVAAEQRFSRFLPESELSRLNRAGAATGVSEALFAALVRAERWSVETNGLFDATLGRELCRLGYDRPFSFGLLDQSDPVAPPNQGDSAVTRRARLTLDRAQRGVVLGPGVELDLGGMIKGATVDEALRGIPLSAAVDAGGDL